MFGWRDSVFIWQGSQVSDLIRIIVLKDQPGIVKGELNKGRAWHLGEQPANNDNYACLSGVWELSKDERGTSVQNFKYICSHPTPWVENHVFCKAVGSIQQAKGKYPTPGIISLGGASWPCDTRVFFLKEHLAWCTQSWVSPPQAVKANGRFGPRFLPIASSHLGSWVRRGRACCPQSELSRGEREAEVIEGGRRQRNKGFDMRNLDGEILQPLGWGAICESSGSANQQWANG